MDVNNQALSLSLYDHLCKVVGSEEVVRTRRKIFSALDYVNAEKCLTYISSESKPKGLDLSGSDHNFMYVCNDIRIYENMDDISNHKQKKPKIPLIMDRNVADPGYIQLKLYDSNHKNMPSIVDVCDDGTYISSKLVRERVKDPELVVHGPSVSSPEGLYDQVSSFYSDSWISQYDKWIRRSRSSWPDNRLTETIVQYGVLFVPVGCKNSPRRDLEFRISFNVAEKVLVHSFSHVQLLCYALLKIILNQFIKPIYEDVLCSYFLKTIMFWISEELVESIWRPHNLLLCFDRCFKRLVYCVTYLTCLHYFIPELDFFEDRFSKSEHESFTCTLQSLNNSGRQCLLQTNIINSFNILNQQLPERIVRSVSALPSVLFKSLSVIDDVSTLVLHVIRVRRIEFTWKPNVCYHSVLCKPTNST